MLQTFASRRSGGRFVKALRRGRVPRRGNSPAEVESLETRILPAVTLLMDYSLDNGFFNDPGRRVALETAANDLGSRLNDGLAAVPNGTWNITDPRDPNQAGGASTRTFSVPANAIRIFVAGFGFGGNQVGQGGWRTNSAARNGGGDFQPYVGFVSFDNDNTVWDFTGGGGPGSDFQAVARHELLHVLGLGHVSQTENSIMRPSMSEIRFPTTVDWAALTNRGWQVTPTPASGTYADVFGRTAAGAWYVSQNLGDTLSTPTGLGVWNETAGWRDVSQGDFNNDGRTDVIGRTAGGQWWAGINTGGAFSSVLFGGWSEAGWRDVKVGDFNADGRDDVAGRTAGGQWWVSVSLGTTFAATTPWAGWTEAAGWRDVSVGDFNADGRSDVAGRTSTGQWWVGLSTGTAFVTTPWAAWTEAAGWRDVRFGDFNGDRSTDIVGRTNGGQWWLAQSTGARFTNLPFGAWSEGANWRGVMVADFAGDARIDLVARTALGGWFVGENTNGGFVFRPFGGWSESVGWRDVQVGNFVGGPRADVIARTPEGGWWVGESNGTQLMFRGFGRWNESLNWRSVSADRNLFSAAQMGAGGQAAALATRTAEVVAEEEASLPLAVFAAPAFSLIPAVRVDSTPGWDEREAELPVAATGASVAGKPEGFLEAAFADGGLLEALLAAT